MSLPDAEFVIIGGGAIGCGVAYARAAAGQTGIVLVERADDVGQVTTSQGAGLCGQARDSVERTRLAMHSVAVFRELQKSSAVKPDWNEVGSVRLALSVRAAEDFRKLKAIADMAGLETALLDNNEAHGLWPLMDFSEVKAVLWCPSDGWMTPQCVAKAYEEQSRKMGARVSSGTVVQNIVIKDGRVQAVQ